jgi:type VI secretion system protein VasG
LQRPDLLKSFKPAFLGRCNVVIYYPLADHVLKQIIGLKLRSIGKRVRETYDASFDVDPAVTEAIVERCREVESGARNIENILNRTLLPELSAVVLERLSEGKPIEKVRVGLSEDGAFSYALE